MSDRISNLAGRRLSKRRRGSAMIEFAVLLPLLITIVLGCIDFGRFAYVLISITNAARTGANYGAMHSFNADSKPHWDAGIKEAVLNDLKWIPGFKEDDLIVVPPAVTNDGSGRRVRVAVGYEFRTVVAWPMMADEVLISRAVEMRSIR